MPERFETWDDQVKLHKVRQAAPLRNPTPASKAQRATPPPAPAESEELVLLRRIATATEKTSRRVASLDLGVGLIILFWILRGLFRFFLALVTAADKPPVPIPGP